MDAPAPAYDVKNAWPSDEASNVDDCLRFCLDKRDRLFHGAHEPWPTIKSSLDLKFEQSCYRGDKHGYEADLLRSFSEECFRYLRPGARMHIEFARVRWNTTYTTGTMFVARHSNLPTRAIDWTVSPLTALFFACRREPKKPGVIWHLKLSEFEDCVATQWPRAYGKCGDIEDDFEQDLISGVDKDVLVPVHFRRLMPRAVAQEAFITVAGRFGMDHAKRIYKLGGRTCRRFIIPACLKTQVIAELDMLGVNGYSLEIGDSTVETTATDVASRCPLSGSC